MKKQKNNAYQKLDPKVRRKQYKRALKRHWELYVFLIPMIVATILFAYLPMYGIFMAFQDVKLSNSIFTNEWVGFRHFTRLFNSTWFPIIMKNTVLLAVLNNVLMWPAPLLLALLLHNTTSMKLKKIVQNATYMPYLLSIVVTVSIINMLCNVDSGLINILLKNMGMDRINFFAEPGWVMPLYIISGIWSGTGQGAIVYLASLSSVDEELIEASKIDGAGKLQRIWYIQLPSILPTVVTMLILNMGKVFAIGADKMLLLQTDLNLTASEIISTYVYKTGFLDRQYGFSTAVDIFQNIINIITLVAVNKISKKLTDMSIV